MVRKFKEARELKNKEVVDEGSQTLPQPAARSTPDMRKRLRKSGSVCGEETSREEAENLQQRREVGGGFV